MVPLGTSPGRRGRDLSHGPIRRFQLQPTGGSPALRLLLVPVRGPNLQMAKFPTVVPELALFQRQLSGEELAFGRGAADPPGAITRLQTCVTPGGSSGVTEQTLGRQLNLERDAELLDSATADSQPIRAPAAGASLETCEVCPGSLVGAISEEQLLTPLNLP